MLKFLLKKSFFFFLLFPFFFSDLFSYAYENQIEWQKGSQTSRRKNLSDAIKEGDITSAKALILYLENINAPLFDQNEMTPLMEAAYYAQIELVKLLHHLGADIEACDRNGYTALSHASCYAKNADPNSAKIVVDFLIQAGADIESSGYNNETPLIRCCYKERYASIAKFLIDSDANIEAINNCGKTPLMIGAMHENITIVKHLLEAGSQVETKDIDGRTALTLAAMFNQNTQVLTLLKAFNANFNTLDLSGKTTLINALHQNKNIFVIKFLIESGAKTETPVSEIIKEVDPLETMNKNLDNQNKDLNDHHSIPSEEMTFEETVQNIKKDSISEEEKS